MNLENKLLKTLWHLEYCSDPTINFYYFLENMSHVNNQSISCYIIAIAFIVTCLILLTGGSLRFLQYSKFVLIKLVSSHWSTNQEHSQSKKQIFILV